MTAEDTRVHRFSRPAMSTAFEVIIRGQEKDYARQAAQAAFHELDPLEKELSRFIEYSDISRINRLGAGESVRVGVAVYDCLQLAQKVHAETNGAFDVTVGALLSCWRTDDGTARFPSEEEIAAARARTGMRLVSISRAGHSVGPLADGVKIDLGAIGKGYAVDQMTAILREWSIGEALIHSGESSVFALGAWSVAIRDPERHEEVLDHVLLKDRALSGSGLLLHGRHIIDPRTGRPAEGRRGTWAAAPTAAESDALSTAFMVMCAREVEEYCRGHEDVWARLATMGAAGWDEVRFGAWG